MADSGARAGGPASGPAGAPRDFPQALAEELGALGITASADGKDALERAREARLTGLAFSGGGIRNASLAAAFLAAEDGRVIGMRHLVMGVALEYGKLGRLTLESDFERFHDLVRSPR